MNYWSSRSGCFSGDQRDGGR